MTSTELHDSSKNDNNEEKEEEIEPKISFRAQYARKSHNNVEKKRKDKIALWINKISELLPKDPKKESKNGILEKAYHYMVHLKETNDKLIYGHADQVTGEQLRLAKKKISNLEETNAVYYKLLKMSGITPNNIPLDVMKPLPLKSTEFKQSKLEADKGNQVSNKNDSEDDAASDTTEVIRDEDIEDFTKSNNTHATKQNISMVEGSHLNPFLNKTPLLIVNQNQDQNAPRISLSNGSQLQIRPSPNVQILGNGALAIDSSGFNQGPIILGSTLLSPPQPTTLLMSNGQVLSLVNQPQPAFVYTPGAGFVLTSTPVSNSIDVPVKTSEQTEKGKKKTKLPVNDELAVTATVTEEKDKSSRPKKSRTYQKLNSRQVGNAIPADDVDLQSNSGQKNGRTTPASKSPRRPRKVPSKIKETANKLTISEVHLQNDGTVVSRTKRTRPTTVIERVADSPVKICDNDKSSSKNNGTLDSGKETSKGFDETLTNDLQGNDISADNRMNDYSFRQNGESGETACEQDQLPLLLSSLSDDHEISTESGHSVSNSSLPTFLSLSPSDHLTDFLSKTSDHNNTTRSPRYSSPINRINTNGQTSQTPSVIISDQSNLINESSNCHHLMGQNNKEGIYEGNNMDLSNKNMESETRDKDNNVSMCVDENYSNSIGQHHQTTNSLTEIGSRKSSDGQESTSSSTVPTVTAVTSLSSNVNAQSSSTNNSTTNQESISQRNFLPYSAESLIRQQPQQQSNNMPSSVPINSIHHVHSNVTIDQNIDYSNRGTGSTSSSTNVSANNARPTISYSAERLIHSPPGEPAVSSNQSNRHKSHETSKVVTISSNNQSNSSTSNIYDQQYSIRNARGSTDLDSNISRIQSNNHHQQQQQQHHQQQQHQEHQHQQQQHIASTVYRPSPQSHDQRTNQDQLHSSRTDLNLNNNPANQPQQILQQQRNVYLDSHGHHHHHQQPQPLSQQPRGQAQSHHSQPNQANSNSQGQLKTTPTNESSSNNATSNSNNSNNANNGREHFNHPYPYSSMPSDSSTTGERNGNIVNFPSGQNENFIENSSQNNFLPPFAPSNNNCQPPFNPTNNRRPSSSSAAMLAPFPFSDSLNSSSFSSDPYNRQPHGASSGSNLTSSASFDANRRIVNSGHFVDNAPTTTSNNSSSNYFMVHNHHAATSSLPTSNNPPIFSTSSTFPSLIPSSTNSNYDTNGYNLTCPPRPSSTINTTANISGSTNTLSNSNLHSHHHPHHHAHHHVFYSDSTVSSLPSMHNSRRQSESSPYSASTVSGKSTNNNSQSKTNNTANTPTTASKQAAKSSGSSSKATKKGSSNSASKSRGQSSTNDARPSIINNPSATSYPSITGFPPPIASSSSSSPSHALNRSVVTTASSALNASAERSADNGEPLFRPQSQSNPVNSSQTSSNRSSGPSSHGLPHSSTFLSSFSFSNIFPEIGPINPNENFAMPGLSTIKFNPANHVLPHHPNPNAPFAHSSHSGPVDNSSGSMNDNSPHQNIYGHHSRIATPHHHNHVSFIPLIGTSPRTLK